MWQIDGRYRGRNGCLGLKAAVEHGEALLMRNSPCANNALLALFNLAVDSKLRGCELVSLRLRDVYLAV